MKKKEIIRLSAFIVLVLGVCALIGVCRLDDRYVEYRRLTGVENFVKAHYPNATAVTAMRDFPDYNVWIDGGTEVEFDFRKNWQEIKVYGNDTIPSSVLALLPAGIPEYVAQLSDSSRIMKISRERNKYEIKLSNRKGELLFDRRGRLIGIDD